MKMLGFRRFSLPKSNFSYSFRQHLKEKIMGIPFEVKPYIT